MIGWLACAVAVLPIAARGALAQQADAHVSGGLTFSCEPDNDLYLSVVRGGAHVKRFSGPADAINQAPQGTGVLLLADGYPSSRLSIPEAVLRSAHEKHLRLFIEFPGKLPGLDLGQPHGVRWERAVVASDSLSASQLPKLTILSVQGCRFLPAKSDRPDLVLARVAGYDTAAYGLPAATTPLLFRDKQGDWIATTKLSNFVTGRYAPADKWLVLWRQVLGTLDPSGRSPRLFVEPSVRPAYSRNAVLPKRAEADAVAGYARWIDRSGLLIAPGRQEQLYKLMRSGVETTLPPVRDEPNGDGSLGLMEGFASQIQPDGSQIRRTPIRADCHAETAMALALRATLSDDLRSEQVARNLLDFLYFKSDMQGGVRGNPKHPAFGLIAWGAITPAWEVANYGDDNARTLLATMAAAACLKSDAWDAAMLEALLANLRTTGKLGFRGDRIDIPALEQNGWRAYHDASPVDYSPHFESYAWACFLWAYHHTGEHEFLDRASNAIAMTMHAYPDGWRWRDNNERSRMLLPLAWLARVDDTPEHRQWLKLIAGDLLKFQQPCGAIQECIGRHGVPTSNEAYGTAETLLVQENGDPVSDQLYTTGFALLGLHEAAAATGDTKLKAAEDRLAEYLVRIQNRSERIAYLDGSWFRAFDYDKWETWASSADVGWGAWSVEAGWGQAWTAAMLAMRTRHTSLWELTDQSRIRDQLPKVRELMSENDGGPWIARQPAELIRSNRQ